MPEQRESEGFDTVSSLLLRLHQALVSLHEKAIRCKGSIRVTRLESGYTKTHRNFNGFSPCLETVLCDGLTKLFRHGPGARGVRFRKHKNKFLTPYRATQFTLCRIADFKKSANALSTSSPT